LITAEDRKGTITDEIQRPFLATVIKFMNKKIILRQIGVKLNQFAVFKESKSVLLNIQILAKVDNTSLK
jgi:hypothetical protein